MPVRDEVLDVLGEMMTENDLRIVNAAIGAARAMGDDRAIALLNGAPARHPDGRVRRDAKAAALRLGKSKDRTDEVARLSDGLEEMRKQNAKLMDRVDALESARKGTAAAE